MCWCRAWPGQCKKGVGQKRRRRIRSALLKNVSPHAQRSIVGLAKAHLARICKFYRYEDNPISGARLAFLAECCSLLGKLGINLPFLIKLSVDEQRSRMMVRDRRDLAVIEEVFVERDYDFQYLPDPRIIVDIGSNIGASVRYFAMKFRDAHIYCFEPNPFAAARLVENTFGRAVTYCPVAVSDHDGFISFFAEQSKLASSSVIDRGESSRELRLPCWSLNTLIARLGGAIDLLKFDVEGAEVELLAGADLSSIREVVGEVHLDLIDVDLDTFSSMLPDFEVVQSRRLSCNRHIVHFRNVRFAMHEERLGMDAREKLVASHVEGVV